ncbi:MAG: PAS domain-containing sensor histidine kinase [Chromatiales bacterium]|nr:PAS domain-containing sensor histidine kinase [Chromatiales bacterium]
MTFVQAAHFDHSDDEPPGAGHDVLKGAAALPTAAGFPGQQPPLALAAIMALPSGVIVLDEHGVVRLSNAAAVQMLAGSVDGLLWRDIISRAFVLQAGGGGDEVGLRDGRHVSISTCPLGPRPGQILVLHDVTETRRLREQVKRNERLTALGEVSAALAHQIRTPLSAALLYSAQLDDVDLDAVHRERFTSRLNTALMNIETLVRDMLLFVRGEVLGATRVPLADLLERLPSALETQLVQFGAQLQVLPAPEDTAVMANADALVTVLQNLIMNSLEAGAERVQVTPKVTVSSGQGDDPSYVDLEVLDDGNGIGIEVREHVFEPFFTTRAGGTGLGLAVARNVIRAHRGDLDIESNAGAGCRLRLRLPLAGQDPDADAERATEQWTLGSTGKATA